MRVNEQVSALNMQNMLFKNKSVSNSLKRTLKIDNVEEKVKLVISEKMKAQIREFENAKDNKCNENSSLNEAITTVQDITGILGDIQDVLQTIQQKISLKENYDNFSNQFDGLYQEFVTASSSEIFNSELFENGLISNNQVITNDFNTCNIEEVKKLTETYRSKLKELEKLNAEFKEKLDTGQIEKINLGAAEAHIQNIATAEEIISKTKNSIINEANTAMLSQANKKPEQVINLLE